MKLFFKLFRKIRQIFCIHDWIPAMLLDKNVYNKHGIRYARYYSVCNKCGKTDDIDYMMSGEFQDRCDT